jgi:hypothetical protein
MTPLALVPAAVFSFLGGISLGKSRKGLSMLPPDRGSPLPGVSRGGWVRFVRVMVVSPKQAMTSRGRMGYFGLDARRLADVGFMRGARKATVGAETGVWTGEWVSPLTLEGFLGSAPAQHEALARSCRRLAPRVARHVGEVIDGRRASLSGLLAAGHLAGEAGIESWVSDPAVRKKFRATTANFHRANEIF